LFCALIPKLIVLSRSVASQLRQWLQRRCVRFRATKLDGRLSATGPVAADRRPLTQAELKLEAEEQRAELEQGVADAVSIAHSPRFHK